MSEELDSTKAELHSFLDQDGDTSAFRPDSEGPEAVDEVQEDLEPDLGEDPTDAEFEDSDLEGETYEDSIADLPRHQRRQMAINPPKMPLVIGMLLVTVAMALGAWEVTAKTQTGAMQLLTQFGINPAILLVSGILLTTLALAQRGVMQSSTHRLLLAFEKEQGKVHNELQAVLEEKLSSQQNFSATNEAEAFEKLGMMFRKIESMLANLTKAMRLLNKPIVDLHHQVADMQDPLKEMGTKVGGIHEAFELLTKSQTEAAVNFEKKWESQMQRQLTETQELLDKYEQVKRELLSNLDKRLDDIDTHVTSLEGNSGFQDGLDEFGKKLETELEEKISKNLDQVTEKLTQLTQQGGEDQNDKLFSEIQESMGRILTVVEDISERPVPVGAAAAPAAVSQASSRSSTGSSGSSGAKSASKSKKSSGSSKSEGGKQGGKKVLSAIEKLKQLRGG